MSDLVLWNMLANHARSGDLKTLSPPLQQKLHSFSDELALILRASDVATRAEILTKLCEEVLGHLPELEAAAGGLNSGISGEGKGSLSDGKNSYSKPIEPAILAWANRQLDEKETVAGMREIRESGGLELDDFMREIEREAN